MSNTLNVVVTGGSSGIGRSIVAKFAAAGHRVYTSFNSNRDGIESLKKQYPKLIEYSFLDQGELSSIADFGNNVHEWLTQDSINGRKIDVLINNAALGSATVKFYVQAKLAKQGTPSFAKTDATSSTAQAFILQAMEDEALMKVNALGPLWMTELLLPMMRQPSKATGNRNYSTILFVGSVGGGVGVFPEYRASDLMSKAAVTYLSKHLAAENIRSNIDVLCLAPGATLTEMFQRSTLDHVADQHMFTSQMPKQRLLDPDELAEAIYHLSTDRWARMFHGGVLDASLGLGVRPGVQTENNARN